ncbi:MAG: carboxypeptidase-like regulatory domain-containing protein, partial [Bacteroidaceae bacterium]|nr:carboxypeptidase-like regulatory domain-containing protein [Bacteroidaceae bacterium]
MKWKAFLVLVLVCTVANSVAQTIISGKVVDAETDEPLSYVRVWANDTTCVLTNVEGRFTVEVDVATSIHISHVGYNATSLKANKVKGTIRLTPLAQQMDGIVVRGFNLNAMMDRATRQLDACYKKDKKRCAPYFFRTVLHDGRKSRMMEALVKAYSAVNVRGMTMISGIDNADAVGEGSNLPISLTNIHRLAELGARTYDCDRWDKCIKPFEALKTWQKNYSTSFELLGEGDSTVVKVNFTPKDVHEKEIMTGTAYVQARDARVLRFDGRIENSTLQSGLYQTKENITFSIAYNYSKDCAEVAHVALTGGTDLAPNSMSTLKKIKYHVLLSRLNQDSLVNVKGTPVREDLMESLAQGDSQQALWNSYGMVQRTPEEESILYGDTPENTFARADDAV